MDNLSALNLGAWRRLGGAPGGPVLRLPARHLVTHGVVVGMTGSGKTGLITVLAEEALSAGIPTLIIDVKGDLPNLLLSFPNFDPSAYEPWLEGAGDTSAVLDRRARAVALSEERRAALASWSLGEPELSAFWNRSSVRDLTPGSSAGEPLHVLSPLERRSSRWDSDPESARAALSAAVSLVLRLLGRDPDPAKSTAAAQVRLFVVAGANDAGGVAGGEGEEGGVSGRSTKQATAPFGRSRLTSIRWPNTERTKTNHPQKNPGICARQEKFAAGVAP